MSDNPLEQDELTTFEADCRMINQRLLALGEAQGAVARIRRLILGRRCDVDKGRNSGA